MFIARAGRPPVALTYELNVHRGECLAELQRCVRECVLPLRARLAPGQPFALAPRLGRALLGELAGARARRELAAWLRDEGLYPITINAFPLEDFHARRVKENVYRPPWTDPERRRLTVECARVLAVLLPEGGYGTVSTLGGTYRAWGHGPAESRRMAVEYLRTVRELVRLEHRTGRCIVLTVEPEPDTTIETAAELIALLNGFVRPAVKDELARPLGIPAARAHDLLARHFALNLDVCHQAVMFRDPVAEWRAVEATGLRVAKLHLTSALALPRAGRAARARTALLGFAEPRYLHQTVVRRAADGGLVRLADLPALRRTTLQADDEVRVHFHVPLSVARLGPLHTTRAATAAALDHALAHPHPPQLVIETYTWPLLARQEAPGALVGGITREFRWVLGRLRVSARGACPSQPRSSTLPRRPARAKVPARKRPR